MRLYADQPVGTVPRARHLRRNAPGPERTLRDAFPHLKWRHQAPVGRYYADILCFSEQLVIEVDGDTHAYAADHDAARTRLIESQGYRVLRVANSDVTQNLESVLTQLSFSLRKDEGNRAQEKGGTA